MMSRIFTALYISYIATAFVLMEVNPTQWLEGGRFSMLLLAFMVWILQTALAADDELKQEHAKKRITPKLEEKDNGR